jgi:hypothetical protein
VLAEAVRDEVEENLLLHAERVPALNAEKLIEDYRRLIKLTCPEVVPYPSKDLGRSSRHLIRHAADVPVLLSAIASKPDWLLTTTLGTLRKPLQNGPACGLLRRQNFSEP